MVFTNISNAETDVWKEKKKETKTIIKLFSTVSVLKIRCCKKTTTFGSVFLAAAWCLDCFKLWISEHLQLNVSICVAYLYFLVKHLAMNPCSSGLSSCLPWDGLAFMWEEYEDMQRNQATQRNHSTLKLIFATELRFPWAHYWSSHLILLHSASFPSPSGFKGLILWAVREVYLDNSYSLR